ncbi:DUF4304 domain-containing protein [Mycobacterium sp. DSM 3803]|nr:DUF4304 domain-containing protein [Mycobacterium sp. DSM 3803]
MVESEARGASFRRRFEVLLSEDVRPFLKARGFTRSGRAFRRQRGPLYDVVDFQGNRWNGVTPWHGFFVNIGVGSADVDAVCERPLCLLSRRWEGVVENLPHELAFDDTTDMTAFAERLCEGLDQVLVVIEKITTTDELVRWAIANNKLAAMEHTCAYLAATDDIDALTEYISALREQFGHQPRWEIFNSQLTEATGSWSETLVERGVLDAVVPD